MRITKYLSIPIHNFEAGEINQGELLKILQEAIDNGDIKEPHNLKYAVSVVFPFVDKGVLRRSHHLNQVEKTLDDMLLKRSLNMMRGKKKSIPPSLLKILGYYIVSIISLITAIVCISSMRPLELMIGTVFLFISLWMLKDTLIKYALLVVVFLYRLLRPVLTKCSNIIKKHKKVSVASILSILLLSGYFWRMSFWDGIREGDRAIIYFEKGYMIHAQVISVHINYIVISQGIRISRIERSEIKSVKKYKN